MSIRLCSCYGFLFVFLHSTFQWIFALQSAKEYIAFLQLNTCSTSYAYIVSVWKFCFAAMNKNKANIKHHTHTHRATHTCRHIHIVTHTYTHTHTHTQTHTQKKGKEIKKYFRQAGKVGRKEMDLIQMILFLIMLKSTAVCTFTWEAGV